MNTKLRHKATGQLFDSSDFETVPSPKYQITSFSHNQGYTNLMPNGNYLWTASEDKNGRGASLESILNGECGFSSYKIYSVKRLSDNVDFTIGDYVTANNGMKGTITRFEIGESSDQMFIYTTWSGVGYGLDGWNKGHKLDESFYKELVKLIESKINE